MPALLNVVSEGDLQQRDALQLQQSSENRAKQQKSDTYTALAGHISNTYEEYRRAREGNNIDERIVSALRAYNGQYTQAKLAEIRQFGGSEVYARLITTKCRGVTAMLRDIFLGSERPWGLKPTSDPSVPGDQYQEVDGLIQDELAVLAQSGAPPPTVTAVAQRRRMLLQDAVRTAVERATMAAQHAANRLQDMLEEGDFYNALRELLIDLPIYPYAVLKGPVVTMDDDLRWQPDGSIQMVKIPRMFWRRVDPKDVYFTPNATCVDEATFIERLRLTRGQIASLLGVPGYDDEAIRQVLRDYKTGLVHWIEQLDSDYADEKSQDNPYENVSELIDALEFHGNVPGSTLLDQGFTPEEVPDPDIDYHVDAWQIGPHIIKAQLTPNPRKRPPYYLSSFEKVPGSLVGHGLPEIIDDIADVANATLRSLVNNMSLASGPQVGINEDRLSPTTDADSMYPWKRWRFVDDPLGNGAPPIAFFQPSSNAQELLSVFQQMTVQADEISAIPRYLTGSSNLGSGATRTSSGLSMLMNNASKVLQNLASQIDADIMRPVLQSLYDIVMLTDDTGLLQGDENIVVQGVSVAVQRETDRMRQLEFLQMTMNPVDMQIIGHEGRAALLRKVSEGLGMAGEKLVPDNEELRARKMLADQMLAAQQGQPGQDAAAPPMGPSRKAPGPARGPEEGLDNVMRFRSPQAMLKQGGGA